MSSALKTSDDISSYLSKPSWSVKDLLSPASPTSPSEDAADTIDRQKLHHLLRLSALPLPADHVEEEEMLKDLRAQLQFVRAIQAVDTTGVEPLDAIRDETQQGKKERTVGLEDPDIKAAFAQETKVGMRGRIKTLRSKNIESEESPPFDPLERAGRTFGRYIVVDTAKD